MSDDGTPRGDDRLDSWKRVATYLKRGVRTVRRWEAEENLPIHRHPHKQQGSIFAYKSEIDTWLDTRSQRPTKKSTAAMLAVLPFGNLTGDTDREHFCDGLTEELISQLGRVERNALGIVARTSIMIYKEANKTISAIGRELGVQYVLEGSVRIDGTSVRITTQLISVHDQTHIWAQNYDDTMDHMLRLQRELAFQISRDICNALDVSTHSVPDQTSVDLRPIDPAVFDTYLKARYLLYRMTGESLHESIRCFQQVIDAAPSFAPANAGQAEALQLVTLFGGASPVETMPRSLEAASRAVAIDPQSGEAFAALGFVHSCYTWDWEASENAFLRAIELGPNLAIAYQWYAELLAILGRFDEAYRLIERARELDPLSLAVATSHGHCLQMHGRAEELIPAMTRVLDMEAHYPLAHIFLGCAYAQLEQYEKSVAVFTEAEKVCGPADSFVSLKGYALGREGKLEQADVQLIRLREMAADVHVSPFQHAIVHIGKGQFDEALDYLEAAFEERTWHVTMIKTMFMWDPVRQHPRFCQLMEKMKFPDVN